MAVAFENPNLNMLSQFMLAEEAQKQAAREGVQNRMLQANQLGTQAATQRQTSANEVEMRRQQMAMDQANALANRNQRGDEMQMNRELENKRIEAQLEAARIAASRNRGVETDKLTVLDRAGQNYADSLAATLEEQKLIGQKAAAIKAQQNEVSQHIQKNLVSGVIKKDNASKLFIPVDPKNPTHLGVADSINKAARNAFSEGDAVKQELATSLQKLAQLQSALSRDGFQLTPQGLSNPQTGKIYGRSQGAAAPPMTVPVAQEAIETNSIPQLLIEPAGSGTGENLASMAASGIPPTFNALSESDKIYLNQLRGKASVASPPATLSLATSDEMTVIGPDGRRGVIKKARWPVFQRNGYSIVESNPQNPPFRDVLDPSDTRSWSEKYFDPRGFTQ